MRILHTADWHFGKTLEGRDRMAEQRQFVDELCDLCRAESVDLVLMAGDVYQTVNPSAEAEQLFYRALDGLSAGGTRGVVVIAGNHDNADRIAAARPLADKLGITLMGLPKDVLTPTSEIPDCVRRVQAGAGFVELQIPGCEENVVIAAVPYPSEARLNEVLATSLDEREMQSTYNERIAAWFSALSAHFRSDTINLAMSHVYVNGGLGSDSEVQIQIGGVYAVGPEVFPANAQYIALGHLHRPQNVAGVSVPMRYAGSPLAYSFSEAGQQKSVVIIDAMPGQPVSWREVPLSSGKPLVRWTATEGIAQVIRWVEEGRDANAWIDLAVHVQTGLQLEDIHRLRDLHPGFVHIRPVLPVQSERVEDTELGERADPSIGEHFSQFFTEKQGVVPDDALVQLFLELVAEGEADASNKADIDEHRVGIAELPDDGTVVPAERIHEEVGV